MDIILSIIFTWSIGLAPPLLARYIIYKKALAKKYAIAFVIIQWIVNVTIFEYLGSSSPHSALFLVGFISYGILAKEKEVKPQLLDFKKMIK